jgi:TetR/AcrR family transcriptional regulator, transcriptional repressor for nem operon
MTKESTREKILAEGARIVHAKGFNNTGIQEILEAVGVPKGSFYFYFKSKEEFGLAVCDHFAELMANWMDKHLAEARGTHIEALKGFFDDVREYFATQGCRAGCPVGNMAQEMADLNEAFRDKIEACLTMMKEKIGNCLSAAQKNNEIDPDLNVDEAADFILNSWEGALIRMKSRQSVEPLMLFHRMVFDRVLKS